MLFDCLYVYEKQHHIETVEPRFIQCTPCNGYLMERTKLTGKDVGFYNWEQKSLGKHILNTKKAIQYQHVSFYSNYVCAKTFGPNCTDKT